ncbi:hypothetical protein VIBNIAM115_1450075 [Vibrio nigripulchritudo AM115]|nr:hypothetical protein VIBNIAM115_1450075 [Vibrio nigripulchritudo AM115]
MIPLQIEDTRVGTTNTTQTAIGNAQYEPIMPRTGIANTAHAMSSTTGRR